MPLHTAHSWVVRAAQILANAAGVDGTTIQADYRALRTELLTHQRTPELEPFVTQFYTVTMHYWRGLFHCYAVAELPRTNNDLEQYFGTARYLERRATGRKRPTTALTVRGVVQVIAAVATYRSPCAGTDLQRRDISHWRRVRVDLDTRHETRRRRHRFRHDPHAYLATLEAQLLE